MDDAACVACAYGFKGCEVEVSVTIAGYNEANTAATLRPLVEGRAPFVPGSRRGFERQFALEHFRGLCVVAPPRIAAQPDGRCRGTSTITS